MTVNRRTDFGHIALKMTGGVQMRDPKFSLENTKVTITILKKFFEREAVFAAAHSLTDSFYTSIDSPDDKTVEITFTAKEPSENDRDILEKAARIFNNELLDQQVRIDLEKRYGSLREMIVKQAFSPISIQQLSDSLKSRTT